MVIFKKQRRDYANNITTELVNCRFGAPKGTLVATIPVKDLKNFEPIKTFLNVLEEYVETGQSANGVIPFKQTGRNIEYSFSSETLDNNNVNLKVL
jgi:hypothetical protein